MTNTSHATNHATPRERLEALVHHLEHVLPAQAPIRDFVHHNTLHGFQHLNFTEAVAAAQRLTGTNGYLPLERFKEFYREDRITDTDIDAALDAMFGSEAGNREAIEGVQHREIWRVALHYPPKKLSRTQLRWLIEEQRALENFDNEVKESARNRLLGEAGTQNPAAALGELWKAILELYGLHEEFLHPEAFLELPLNNEEEIIDEPSGTEDKTLPRELRIEATQLLKQLFGRVGEDWTLRRLILALTGEDLLEELRPHLIRHIASHLDQGLAASHNPERARGFYAAWRAAAARDPGWLLRDLPEWQLYLERLPEDPVDTILEELRLLGLDEKYWPGYLERLALEIPGWSGMALWRSMHPGYSGSTQPMAMLDYLAVCLVLERLHALRITRRHWHVEASLPALRGHLRQHPAELVARHALFDARLPEHLTALGQRQIQEALQHRENVTNAGWRRFTLLISAWRQAPTRDRLGIHSVSGTAWPLFVLCQHLGIGAERLRDLGREGADTLMRMTSEIDSDRAGYLWLWAYEFHYREQIFAALAANHGRGAAPAAPVAQLVFCMDDREEGTRRHLEEINPRIETFGAAGFFGVAINWRGLDDENVTPLCPVVVTPAHEVQEVPRQGEEATFGQHRRWQQQRNNWKARLFHDTRHGIIMALLAATIAVPAAALTLAGRLLWPRWHARLSENLARLFDRRVTTELVLTAPSDSASATPQSPRLGFTDNEQVDRVEGLLRVIGLTKNFAPLVVLFGHGSMSRNNPHLSAYDCGACSGRHGGPNARVFSAMANRPEIRSLLAKHGIAIPDGTWFLGAEHNTCDDGVTFFDEQNMPASQATSLDALKSDLRAAARAHAQERCRRFASAPSAPGPARALRHVEARMQDFSQPRPELGHVTNATALIGRRSMSRGVFFDRRAYLISYDPAQDDDGKILEAILLAAGPVGAGISLEYYFSTVNNEGYGCGTKTVHNLTGLFGVMEGTSSDLRTGLPQQMIEIHEAMRLLIIVEHRTEVLTAIYERQPPLRELIGNGWVLLASKNPDSGVIHFFEPAHGWQHWNGDASVQTVEHSQQWFQGHRNALPPALITRPLCKEERVT